MEKKTDSLLPLQNKLSLIENQILIGNKLLHSENSLRFKRLIEIANRNPIPVLDMVCSSYHFTELEITIFKDKIIWKQLSANPNLQWCIDLIDKYKDYWNWKRLSGNKYLPWSKDLILEYESNWEWQIVARNGNNFIEKTGKEFIQLENHLREHFEFREKIKSLQGVPNSHEKVNTKRRYVSENDISKKDEDAYWKKQSYNAELDWGLDLFEELGKKLDWNSSLQPYKYFQKVLFEILNAELLSDLFSNSEMPLKTYGESSRFKDHKLFNINKSK